MAAHGDFGECDCDLCRAGGMLRESPWFYRGASSAVDDNVVNGP